MGITTDIEPNELFDILLEVEAGVLSPKMAYDTIMLFQTKNKV